ncbi:serine protease, partial [Klebsiella pneumoniae]|nr:serine protease [Klebsiella pneumoniae]
MAIGLFRGNAFIEPDGLNRSGELTPDAIPDSYGTGVVLDERGLILTNYHVIRDKADPYVRVGGQPVWCVTRVKGAD